jgi:RecA-family ATPase
MRTAAEILREFGLPEPPAGADRNRYYSICPQCSHLRSPEHQKTECLGITIDDKGVRWGCNHCPWSGGEYFRNGKDRDPVIAIFEYTDANGALLFRKFKTAAKKFWQARPDGHGGWLKNLKDVPHVLYRLPELIEDLAAERMIVLTEGEKDTDSLRRIGVPATSNSEGASEPGKKQKWRAEYSEALRGADVVLMPDHDPPGYARVAHIGRELTGIAKRVRVLTLAEHWPECPKGGDVSDWLRAGHTREQFDALIADAKPITDQVKGDAFEYVDITRELTPRDWVVPDRVPAKNITLFSGEGSVGKSLLLLQLSAAIVLGRDWLGTMPKQGSVLYLSCEEDDEEITRRLEDVAKHYGVTRADLKPLLHVVSLAGKDAILGVADRSGAIRPTQLFERLRTDVRRIQPVLVVADTVADVFAGDELNRAQTRHFLTLGRGLAIEEKTTLILASHPSLTGIASGSGISGSTAWHNSVRSRMYMRLANEVDDPELRVLEVKKANYAKISEQILLRWKNGVYVPEPRAGSLEQMAEERKIDDLFIDLLRRFTGQGRKVTDRRGPSYAPAKFAEQPDAKLAKVSSKAFAEAMERLLVAGKIKVLTEGPPSHPRTRLVEAGLADTAP